LQRGASYGFSTMGTLSTNDYWPTWADNGGVPNLDMWQQFVFNMVSHYKPLVHTWEIWNEPSFQPDFCAQMMKRACDAIEAADPTARIVGMGGLSLYNMQNIIASMEKLYPTWDWKAHLDILSTHQYAGGTPEPFKANIIDKYGVQVWNTETGSWCQGFYQGVD